MFFAFARWWPCFCRRRAGGRRPVRLQGRRESKRCVFCLVGIHCRLLCRQRFAEDAGNCRHSVRTSSAFPGNKGLRSEEHTSELQSLMRISYAVFCLKKKNKQNTYIIKRYY